MCHRYEGAVRFGLAVVLGQLNSEELADLRTALALGHAVERKPHPGDRRNRWPSRHCADESRDLVQDAPSAWSICGEANTLQCFRLMSPAMRFVSCRVRFAVRTSERTFGLKQTVAGPLMFVAWPQDRKRRPPVVTPSSETQTKGDDHEHEVPNLLGIYRGSLPARCCRGTGRTAIERACRPGSGTGPCRSPPQAFATETRSAPRSDPGARDRSVAAPRRAPTRGSGGSFRPACRSDRQRFARLIRPTEELCHGNAYKSRKLPGHRRHSLGLAVDAKPGQRPHAALLQLPHLEPPPTATRSRASSRSTRRSRPRRARPSPTSTPSATWISSSPPMAPPATSVSRRPTASASPMVSVAHLGRRARVRTCSGRRARPPGRAGRHLVQPHLLQCTRRWAASPTSAEYLHEMGHALGLKHGHDSQDVRDAQPQHPLHQSRAARGPRRDGVLGNDLPLPIRARR